MLPGAQQPGAERRLPRLGGPLRPDARPAVDEPLIGTCGDQDLRFHDGFPRLQQLRLPDGRPRRERDGKPGPGQQPGRLGHQRGPVRTAFGDRLQLPDRRLQLLTGQLCFPAGQPVHRPHQPRHGDPACHGLRTAVVHVFYTDLRYAKPASAQPGDTATAPDGHSTTHPGLDPARPETAVLIQSGQVRPGKQIKLNKRRRPAGRLLDVSSGVVARGGRGGPDILIVA